MPVSRARRHGGMFWNPAHVAFHRSANVLVVIHNPYRSNCVMAVHGAQFDRPCWQLGRAAGGEEALQPWGTRKERWLDSGVAHRDPRQAGSNRANRRLRPAGTPPERGERTMGST